MKTSNETSAQDEAVISRRAKRKRFFSRVRKGAFRTSPFVLIIVLFIFYPSVSTIMYKDQRILVLHPATIFSLDKLSVTGVVLKTYTLITEYGPITIRPFCKINTSSQGQLATIERRNFEKNRASHMLYFDEKPISKNIHIAFYDTGLIKFFLTRDYEDLEFLSKYLREDNYFRGAAIFDSTGELHAYNAELTTLEAYQVLADDSPVEAAPAETPAPAPAAKPAAKPSQKATDALIKRLREEQELSESILKNLQEGKY
jgi:hypothetical protein